MKLKELYILGKEQLNNLEDGDFDCLCLCNKFLSADRKRIILDGNLEIEESFQQSFLSAVEKRKSGYPLQYILGSWSFMDMELKLRDGVLIPREDTEVLVRSASSIIGDRPLIGADLCSGTGAVALGIISLCKKAELTAMELYPIPLACLEENVNKYGQGRVSALKGDVLNKETARSYKSLDFIVSNPPYIATKEINTLQKEVRLEPTAALDGGTDGLIFYREITELWTPSLKTGGFLAFEIGETQFAQVKSIMENCGYKNISLHKDFGELDRVIIGTKA